MEKIETAHPMVFGWMGRQMINLVESGVYVRCLRIKNILTNIGQSGILS